VTSPICTLAKAEISVLVNARVRD